MGVFNYQNDKLSDEHALLVGLNMRNTKIVYLMLAPIRVITHWL